MKTKCTDCTFPVESTEKVCKYCREIRAQYERRCDQLTALAQQMEAR